MTNVKNQLIKAAIYANTDEPTIGFAASELVTFLSKTGYFELSELNEPDPQAKWAFYLNTDESLPKNTFTVTCVQKTSEFQVNLAGLDATCVLHAVYTLLERIGYCFEISGPRPPASPRLDNLKGWSARVKPAVSQRGIRQHLNFPMDISGYSLDEAREYIRNLARMRMNHITFHSYPGQWYAGGSPKGEKIQAGAFFYDQRHDIPDHPVLKKSIRNQKTFCIPDIEPYYDNPIEKNFRTIEWLNAVMNEAKTCGLTIQFSFELHEQDLEASLDTCEVVLNSYPNIDILEIVTQETGGGEEAESLSSLRDAIVTYFGEEALKEPQVARCLKEGQPGLSRLIKEIGRGIKAAENIKKRKAARKLTRLCLGVYCTVLEYLPTAFYLLRKYAPRGIEFSILPSHGARAVADNLTAVDLFDYDAERAMIYSWIEFDGLMYLQQNPLEGIRQLLVLEQSRFGGKSINGICLNHWRTTENRTTFRYASLAFLHGAVNIESFYREYANSLQVGNVEAYTKAMSTLDNADTEARDNLFNIGFCFVGCWGDSGLGYYGNYESGKVVSVRQKYEAVLEGLNASIQATKDQEGLKYLTFLANRVQCTITYLLAFEKAIELQPICKGKAPGDLSSNEQLVVRRICDQALELMEQYMELHAQRIEDRGCEGTLISFYYTPPAVLKRIRSEFGGEAQSIR